MSSTSETLAVPGRRGVEVCFVSFESAAVLCDTIDALLAAAPEVTVAVREHGTDPDAVGRLRLYVEGLGASARWSHDPSNPGFGSGCDALAAGSDAEVLVFLNPDAVVVEWPWSRGDPPPTGVVLGPHMLGDGAPGRHAGRSMRIRDEIGRSWLRRTGPLPDGEGFVSGAALLIDRASFDSVGGFDEAYFMFYEDIDLCLRANEAGFPTRIDPRWVVRHDGAHSTNDRFADAIRWSYESACRFHGSQGSSVSAYRAYVAADAALRSLADLVIGERNRWRPYVGLAMRSAREAVVRRAGVDRAAPRAR